LIHLHPDDFDTFSPHVGKWVERSVSGYRENTTDAPPEAIEPGNIPVCAPFLDFTIEPRGDEDEQHAHQHVDPVKD
jgi:hypothetical protein